MNEHEAVPRLQPSIVLPKKYKGLLMHLDRDTSYRHTYTIP